MTTACAERSATPIPALVDTKFNRIAIDASSHVTWNDRRVSDGQLAALFKRTAELPVEPELQLSPDASASYEMMDRVMTLAQRAGVTKMGFVGNEAYAAGTEPE